MVLANAPQSVAQTLQQNVKSMQGLRKITEADLLKLIPKQEHEYAQSLLNVIKGYTAEEFICKAAIEGLNVDPIFK